MSKPMEEINQYKCPKCKKVIDRRCAKEWIKSFCTETNQDVRLQLIKQ